MKFNLDIKDTNLISLPHHPSCRAVTSLTWLPTFTVMGGNMTGLHCINKADVTQVELFSNNFQPIVQILSLQRIMHFATSSKIQMATCLTEMERHTRYSILVEGFVMFAK